MDNQDKFPTALVVISVILVLAFIIYAIGSLTTGLSLFIEEGGWKWLLVILGLLIFVIAMMSINRK